MTAAAGVHPSQISAVPALPVGPPPILAPTDGSDEARLALRVAVDLARHTGAPLHLVHAWRDPVGYDYMAGVYGVASALEFRDDAAALVAGEAARAMQAGLGPTEARLENGSPGTVVEREAARVHAAFIVMGSRGLGKVGRLLTGSLSDELVQHASCPVLVCRGGRRAWPPTDIYVGDDFSEDAYVAAYAAAVIAMALDLPVHLVHAISPRYAANDTPGRVRRRRDAEHAAAQAMRERAGWLAAETGAVVDFEVQVGDPASALLDHVGRRGHHGLLAVGRRGRGMVRRAVLGGVSTRLLSAARGPVLVVPPGLARQ